MLDHHRHAKLRVVPATVEVARVELGHGDTNSEAPVALDSIAQEYLKRARLGLALSQDRISAWTAQTALVFGHRMKKSWEVDCKCGNRSRLVPSRGGLGQTRPSPVTNECRTCMRNHILLHDVLGHRLS
jgi:hypothetical protein